MASNNKLTTSERVREKMLLKSGTDTKGLIQYSMHTHKAALHTCTEPCIVLKIITRRINRSHLW